MYAGLTHRLYSNPADKATGFKPNNNDIFPDIYFLSIATAVLSAISIMVVKVF